MSEGNGEGYHELPPPKQDSTLKTRLKNAISRVIHPSQSRVPQVTFVETPKVNPNEFLDYNPITSQKLKDAPFFHDESLSKEQVAQLTSIYNEATRLLSTYLPGASPIEQTYLVALNNGREAEGGFYGGKIREKHYIGLFTDISKPLSKAEQEDLSIILSHEMLHQRHAELIGQEAFFGETNDQYLKDQDLEDISMDDVYRKVIHSVSPLNRTRLNIRNNPSDMLAGAVMEGIARTGERIMALKKIEELKAQNEQTSHLVKRLEGYRDEHGRVLQRMRDYPFFTSANPYIIGTQQIMKGLAQKYGYKEIPNLIRYIDIPACRKIEYGSEQYKAVIADPSLLPGLETYHPDNTGT